VRLCVCAMFGVRDLEKSSRSGGCSSDEVSGWGSWLGFSVSPVPGFHESLLALVASDALVECRRVHPTWLRVRVGPCRSRSGDGGDG